MAKALKFLAMDETGIKGLIGTIGKDATSLAAKIQTAAAQVTIHALTHGDVRLARELLDACGKGVRKASLVAWFEANGPFVWSENKLQFFKQEGKQYADGDKLLTISWVEAKKETIVSTIDVEDMMQKMFKRIEAAIKDSKEVKNRALYDALLDASAAYHAALADAEEEALPDLKAA